MRLRPGKRFARNLLEQSFAQAHAGDRKIPDVQVAPERHKRNRGYANHVRAVPPDPVALHALAYITLQKIRQPLAQQREFQGRKSVQPRSWSDFWMSFRVDGERNRNLVAEIRPGA